MHAAKLLNIYWILIANLASSSPVTKAEKKNVSSYEVYISYKIKEPGLFRIQIFWETFLFWVVIEETIGNPADKIPNTPQQFLPCNPLPRLFLRNPSMKTDSLTNTKGQCSKRDSTWDQIREGHVFLMVWLDPVLQTLGRNGRATEPSGNAPWMSFITTRLLRNKNMGSLQRARSKH